MSRSLGRPREFNEEILQKAKRYISSCVDSINEENEKVVKLPSVTGLALYLGFSRETMYAWQKENTAFSDILDDILAEQEVRLLNNGLGNVYNSNIVKLALGKHGYHDQQQVDHTTKGEKMEQMSDAKVMELVERFEAALKKQTLE